MKMDNVVFLRFYDPVLPKVIGYAWKHKKGTRPITKKQKKYFDEMVARWNEEKKYE